DTYPILLSFTHCGNKSILRVLRIILVILPEHPSETKVLHNEDGNPARANIKQALGSYERPHKGVKASANSDIVYFFTSAQDGDPLQDDVRLCLGDDLKKAQDHNQRQVKDESKDHYPKESNVPSIDEGPFQMGTTREIIDEGTEGPINLGPERPRVYSELSQEEKDSTHQTKESSNVVIGEHIEQSGEWPNPGQVEQVKCYNCNRLGHIARNYTQPKRPQNSEYFKDKMLLMQAQENGVILDEEQSLFLAGGLDNAIDEDVDEQPVQDLALNVDNISYDEAGPSYDSDVLSEVQAHDHYQDAVSLKEQNSRPIKALTVYHPNTPARSVPRVLSNQKTEKQTFFFEHDNIIADCLLKEVFYVASNSELNVVRFTEMQKAHHVVKTRCLELEAELSNLRDDVRKDNYNDLLNRFSNLEVNHLNLQLKYQNLKDSFQNKPSSSVNDTPDFNSVFVIGQMKASLQGKDNVIQKLKMQISQFQETRSELDRPLDLRARDFQISQLTEKVNSLQEQNELFRAENAKIKQHYKELYDSIKITRAKHTEQTTALKNENESLKVQIQNTVSCVTTTQFKPKVTAPGKYALDVEPIPPRNRNNREVHLVYLRHLKESVDTLREIVEEAKVERPLDRSLAFACRYTKHSQELLEYVFGTCPKVFNQQDKMHANTPRKKQVTFEDQSAPSSSTTHKHVEPMHTQKSNVPVPPSTGVNSCTDASGSQPRSILKKHRIPPAKSDGLKKVEDHSRTIRSSLK
ncbi:integrase, catalytic region, zinc finger, CCHC-type containing protein, partial [Tanacetum coccineum]